MLDRQCLRLRHLHCSSMFINDFLCLLNTWIFYKENVNFQVIVKKSRILQNKHEYKINCIEIKNRVLHYKLLNLDAFKKEYKLVTNSEIFKNKSI